MIVDLSISRDVNNRLELARLHLIRLAKEAAAARADVGRFKVDELAIAKRDYEDALTTCTMSAYAEGALTGKNQAERDVQLASFLANRQMVLLARRDAETAEITLANLEAAATDAEAVWKAATYEVNALIAQANLQRAMLELAALRPREEDAPPF